MRTNEPHTTTPPHRPETGRKEQPFFGGEQSQRPFFVPQPVQPKLKIGAADDPQEREADAVADRVVQRQAFESASEEEHLQRKCAACAAQEEVRPKPVASATSASEPAATTTGEFAQRLRSSRGGGRAIPESTRTPLESAMGADFSGVRVHTDPESARLSEEIGARAFTHGSEIYFNRGQYDPGTSAGRHLLAHELTHTVQQGASGGLVQRSDFTVEGINPASSRSSRRIFFDLGRSNVTSTEALKLAPFAGSSQNLTLKGLTSEEGSDEVNTRIANARIRAVSRKLTGMAYSGTITPVVDISSGVGNIEYQSMRAVEIIPAGSSSTVPPAVADVPCDDAHAGGSDYPGKFTGAEARAQQLIVNAQGRLSGTRSAGTNAALQRFFGSNTDTTAGDIGTKLTEIGNQVAQYLNAANHKCVNQCSNTTASNMGFGTGAMLTICPTFFSEGLTERSATLIHEAVHGTPTIRGGDTAYRHHRLIEFLTTAQAMQNPDSYRLFVLTVNGLAPDVGPDSPDVARGMNAIEEQTVKKALAWLEMYLTRTYLQTKTLYGEVNELRATGATSWTNAFYENMMAKASPHFELTVPPAVPTTEADQVKLAAVFHRYRIMRNVFWSPVTIDKGTDMAWSAGPGNTVEVNDAFFGLSSLQQVLTLLRLIVAATDDISGALEPRYVAFANEVRQLVGAPDPPP